MEKMNKKGQVLFYTLMLATLILVVILSLAKPTKEIINTTTSDMNCSAPSTLSEYDQATCYGYDILLWFFISLGIALAFVVLGAKIVGG
jgi:hypothetical protein